jgi:hypothetical protein
MSPRHAGAADCVVCGTPLDAAGEAPVAGAPLHAGCLAGSLPGDLLAVFTTVAAMVLAPMVVVWGG